MKPGVAAVAAVFATYPQVRVELDPETGSVRVFGSRDGTIDEIRETGTPMSDQQRKMLFSLARQYGFSDADRHDLAEFVLRRDVDSWADLTQHEAARLIDSFQGFDRVSHLLLSRPPRTSSPAAEPQTAEATAQGS